MSSKDYEKINEHIKEFLKFNGYTSTLECLEAEERTKKVTSKSKQSVKVPGQQAMGEDVPKMYKLFEGEGSMNQRE